MTLWCPGMAGEHGSRNNDPYASAFRRRYVVSLLTVIYVLNLVDRQILSILQQSIKVDLGLSDAQLGLLTGFAFATFYVLAGIPIARWADRGTRRTIIALAVGTWSLMTALCGLAQNYAQLFAARVGVGVGEAGCSPPAHSMISDLYPPRERASALSIYNSGIYLGVLFGFLFGGILNDVLGWRYALISIGLPGVFLSILVLMTVPEPLRGRSDRPGQADTEVLPFKLVLAYLWAKKSTRYVAVGGGLSAFCAYSVMNWMAPYMMRIHEMPASELGAWLALSVGVFGGIGTVGSGFLADRLGRRDSRWYIWMPGLAMALSAPLYLITFNMQGSIPTLLVLCLPMCLSNVFATLSIYMIHGVAEPRMRATGSALYFLIANFIGLGLGPLTIGIFSDLLAANYGVESIRYSMLFIIPPVSLLAGLIFLSGARHLRQDLLG